VSSSQQARPSPRHDPGQTARPARRRVSPGAVILAVALVGSLAYALYALTNRDASIPLLASGAVVLGIVFGALAVYCLRSVWRAGLEGRDGRAIAIGVTGGVAAMIAAGCVAAAIILFQLISPPAA
jgi:FtsH-binding integral membrane protein